ncbi:MAG: nucleotidyltransferase domain-containing protein [Desulfurococcales archaeon]|nr:nucleotidyltransferase domain-containing protein [Desulfurococcales archaeon]
MSSSQTVYLLRTIKDVIINEARKEGVKVRGIILFGSRARGDYREDSDWDLLIVVGGSPNRETVRRLQYRIYRALSRNRIYCDVIVVNEEYYVKYKNIAGTIAYYAHLEGKRVE